MRPIEVGQVLALRIRFNNTGDISKQKHPYLVVSVSNELGVIEIAQIDSVIGKEHKLYYRSNKLIICDNPAERVIDKDSYIQMDNKIVIQAFDDVAKYRRQEDKLSSVKLNDVIRCYNVYQSKFAIDENKVVYLTKDEILKLND